MTAHLTDARLARHEYRSELERRAHESGWLEIGGQLIRDLQGKPVDRTRWMPRAEWYQRMQQDPDARIPGGQRAVAKAVALALRGDLMTPQQRRTVRWMLDDFESYADWREQEAREVVIQFGEGEPA